MPANLYSYLYKRVKRVYIYIYIYICITLHTLSCDEHVVKNLMSNKFKKCIPPHLAFL